MGDPHTVHGLADRQDLGVEADLLAELLLKRLRKLVHAPGRLEHRHHAGAFDDRTDAVGDARLQQFAAVLFRPGPLEDYPEIENPLGVPAGAGRRRFGWLLLLVALVGGPVSLFLRMRRASRIERQQIKWLALAGAFAAARA